MEIEIIARGFLSVNPSKCFRECHAATCVKDEKDNLLVAYFAGTKEGAPDVGIWISRRIDGIWQEPRRIKYLYDMPHWNPILHRDGDKVLLYYKVGQSPRTWYTLVTESYDFGETWTESREAVPGDHTSRIATRNKFLVTEDGRWLAGNSSESATAWDCSIDISEDKGQTWSLYPIVFDHSALDMTNRKDAYTGVIQPALWQSSENKIHCLMRSTEGWIYRSDSVDGGQTWSAAYPTDMPNNNSGITVTQLPDQRLVMVYNPNGSNWGARTPLSVAVSDDNGQNWTKCLDLETAPGEYSYPYLISEGNRVWVVYTWNRKNIGWCEMQI